ncbi:olfactory receptor 4P4-like [Tachyglossus aculeatus]|uniref:olfactory receptor 4P4-like n=1 Tax=Tachyglossus aculeatus TaxID=9261 RepID=UPI0018F508A6|nr:olfactory receptor 4P4-like [Tachyglossus aculeatus]
MGNQKNITEFILLGLSQDQNVQIFCFVLFLFCYIILLMGNLLILITVGCSYLINQPMYYFLAHLSSIDMCYTSTVTPKLIWDLLAKTKVITFDNCMLQLFSMHFFTCIEVFILTAMAFDRYVAICRPLHYVVIMSRKKCKLLILASWVGGAIHAFPQLFMVFQLSFCGPNEVDHYFCDIFPLLKVACVDTYLVGVLVVANSGMVALVTFIVLLGSYVVILFFLRTHSAQGRRKALSTCGSHITVVFLFFTPSIFTYLRPPSSYSEDKVFSLFYTIIAPMFNPLIYTLRNSEMKNAMRKVWCRKVSSEGKLI